MALRRWLAAPAGLFTAAALLLSRFVLLFLYTPNTTDTRIYFRWLSQAAAGLVPLVDFPVEYPPFAWWVMHVPAAADRLVYQFRFRSLMAAADIASFAILAWIVSKRRPSQLTAFACIYIVAPLLLAHELYDRLDMGVLLFVALGLGAWLAAFERPAHASSWLAIAYDSVGLGTAYKLFPTLIMPFFVLSELLTRVKWRAVVVRCVLFAAVAAGPVALTYLQVGRHAFDFLSYHGTRGIEFGSTWASLMWLLTLAGYHAEIAIRFGSWELVGPAEAAVLKIASLATVVVPCLLAVWALLLGGRFTGARAYVQAALAFSGVVILSKVFSPQFLIWAMPVIALLAVEVCQTTRGIFAAGTWLVACSALTTLVYQGGGSGEIIKMPAWIMIALVVRNAMYVSLWVYLAGALLKRDWARLDVPEA